MKLNASVPIKLATVKDAEEIACMSRDYIEEGLGWSWNTQRVLRYIREPEVVVAVAKAERELQGFAIMQFGEDNAHLNLLAVRTRYRRRGLGKRLLRWLEATAITAGTFKISLELRETNRSAHQFYQRLGYRPIKRIAGYYQGREAAIRMGRNVSVVS
ncbi:MAG: GNAT family N-acetyltransferase [Pseudomonadales bacterium]